MAIIEAFRVVRVETKQAVGNMAPLRPASARTLSAPNFCLTAQKNEYNTPESRNQKYFRRNGT